MLKKHGKGVRWTEEEIDYIISRMKSFLLETECPYIATFLTQPDILISIDSFNKLLKVWPELRDMADICKMKCESDLVNGALKRKFDNVFAIFMLKNVAGWRDEKYIDDKKITPVINIVNYGTLQRVTDTESSVSGADASLADRSS